MIRSLDELYKRLRGDNEEEFFSLYVTRYREIYMYLKRSWPPKKEVEDLAELFIAKILTEPSAITNYAYDAESLRKRDRAAEAINSERTKTAKDFQFEKALRFWSQQTGFYIDIIADEAALQSMKDCGVKRVRWRTQDDEKVCADCEEHKNKVYDIDKVPVKEHPRCRCWLEPVS